MTSIISLFILAIFTYSVTGTQKREDDVNIHSLETLIHQQSALLQQQSAAMQQQSAQLQVLQTQVTALQTQLAQTTAELTSLKASQQKQAAFSVTFQGGQHNLDIGENAVIKFDKVITNTGNGYSPVTGIFTAPYAGVYTFFFGMRSANGQPWIVVGIFKGNDLLTYTAADPKGDPYDEGFVYVTTHLTKGEKIYTKRQNGSTYLESGYLTTFSGALVSAD